MVISITEKELSTFSNLLPNLIFHLNLIDSVLNISNDYVHRHKCMYISTLGLFMKNDEYVCKTRNGC